MRMLPILFVACGVLSGPHANATLPAGKHLQPNAPRTVTVSDAEQPPVILTGQLQATLIVLPPEEKVATVFGGDTVNWVFDGGHVASRFISVKPKTAGSTTDLHIVSDHGNEYTLQLREVSADADPHFDSKVLIAPGDQAAKDKLAAMPVFVPAADLEKAKADTAAAKADAGSSSGCSGHRGESSVCEDGRVPQSISGTLHFDYTWDRKKGDALGLQQVWHDDRFTYLRGQFQETPALYEVKDGSRLSSTSTLPVVFTRFRKRFLTAISSSANGRCSSTRTRE